MTRSRSVESQLSKGLKSFRSPSIKRSQCMSSSSLLYQKPAKQPKLKKNEMRLTLDHLIRLDNTIHNTREAVTLLNREGYFVKDPVVTCKKKIQNMKC